MKREKRETELYSVEFNWKQESFHIEPLKGRLKKNIAQLLYGGKPANPDWAAIGVVVGHQEAAKYIEAFRARWKQAQKAIR